MQKRLDLSLRKSFHPTEHLTIQYELNAFNVFNTTSLDVPQDQTQIRQNNACSATANAVDDNNCQLGFVNYGQIATSPSTADQQSALANLDQKPFHTGSGKTTAIPTMIGNSPNNGANFGSVTGTIGGGRSFTMGLHINY